MSSLTGRCLFPLFSASILILAIGCAGPRTMLMQTVRNDLRQANFSRAYDAYKNQVKQTQRVDELLNLGLLAFEAGDYSTSFRSLEEAERLAEERQTKSLSREAAGVAVSDRVRAYQGTVFDKAMLHYYRGLGFLARGDLASATVEGRRIASYLEVNARESKHTYKDDGFLQWYSGALYDGYGQVNDAWIAYKRAREIYKDGYYGIPEPSFLCPVTLAAVRKVGHAESERELAVRCPDAAQKLDSEWGRVIVICEAGLAPAIQEENILLPIYKNDPHHFENDEARERYAYEVSRRRGEGYYHDSARLDYFLRVALPFYAVEYEGSAVRAVAVRTGNGMEISAEQVQDVGAILRTDLQDRLPAILTRAITRALIKYAAAKAAESAGNRESKVLGGVLGGIVNAVGAATEAADTRSWETLPDRIYVADFQLPPGSHHLSATFEDSGGGTLLRHDFPAVDVKRGEVAFLRVRCVK